MRKEVLAYAGLIGLLGLSKIYPQLSFLIPIYMVSPLLFIKEEELGFKNFKRGLLFGSIGLPMFVASIPVITCLGWFLNQVGIATAEEVFFRGFLMRSFSNLQVSLMFSLAHIVSFPTLNSLLVFFPSLVFGYVYMKSGSILAPIIVHLSSNLFYFRIVEEFPELYHFLNRELTGG